VGPAPADLIDELHAPETTDETADRSPHVSAASLIAAIAPVILVLALGFGAGKRHQFDADQARGFSRLALGYALPAALFLGMAHFDRALLLQQGPIALVMLVGYSGLFLALYWVLRALHMATLEAALLGYTLTSTAVPIYGLTVLVPIYGSEVATGLVGLAALMTNLTQVSVAVFLLQSAAKSTRAPSILATIGRSAVNPLVWAPVLGAIFALSGLRLSPYLSAALQPLAVSAAGVAIFASGLALAAHPLKLTSSSVLLGSLFCLAIQPAVFFAMMKLTGVTGTMAQATFVGSTMPIGTPAVLFAQQYGTLEAETAGIMLVTTIGMVVVLPAGMALSAYL
jgi:malonate transporter